MEHLYWIASAVALILICFILRISVKEIRSSGKSKLFIYVVSSSIVLISIDLLWVLSEMNILMLHVAIDYVLAAIYYAMTGIAGFFCFLYSEGMQREKTVNAETSRYKGTPLLLCAIPVIILTVMSVTSVYTGWLFTIGEDGIHVRGPLYILQPIIATAYPLVSGVKAIVLTVRATNPYQRNRRLSISLYCMLLVALGSLQAAVPAVPFLNIATAIAVAHAYFFINTFEREQFMNYSKIRSFSKLFLSAYYVDTKERTLERIDIADHIKTSDEYFEHIQLPVRPYDKAMAYYIKTFVHPDDAEMYRKMTTIDYMMERLSSSEPYYYITYRQVIGTSCKWYRMYVTLTSVAKSGEPQNVMLSTMDVDDEQRLVSSSNYYKDMFTNAAAGVYSKIMQVNIAADMVYAIKFEHGEMIRENTGRNVKEHLEHFAQTVAPDYRDGVITTCQDFLEKSRPGDSVSYGYKGAANDEDAGWFVTTIRAMEYEGDKMLLIFVTNNTDKVKHRDMLEEKRRSDAMNDFIVNVLSSAVEFRSLETGDHVNRVIDLTRVILKEYVSRNPDCHLTDEDIHRISSAAALHDVGKIAIPDHILLKNGKLTDEEYTEMKKHTVYGCQMLERFENKNDIFYRYCYDICRYHHERYDGRGYPDGLIGDEIPLWAQIVSVVDVYDALISTRTYKPAYSPEVALRMINTGECGTFSPKVLECLNATVSPILGINIQEALCTEQ